MFRIARAWPVLFGLLLLSACTGGDPETVGGGNGFDLRITTDTTDGPAPLTVSFFVTPSGGVAPFTYAWDFNDDGVIDSNAPSGQFTFQSDSIARVSVTDARGITQAASVTITITDSGPIDPPPTVQPLVVRFNAAPQIGRVPFDVQFTPVISGGRAPYSFAWDFEGDGLYDEFTMSPLHRYELMGQRISEDHFAFFPVLKVTDSRGVTETNLQDIDGNPGPDGLKEIRTLTEEQDFFVVAFANPQAGQAPLTVEFSANVAGGSNDISYHWDFGDNTTDISPTSQIMHTYTAAGTYLAKVTAHDNESGLQTTSAELTITAAEAQPFELEISADVFTGQVPFVVNFEANPTNGQEPIQYEWTVFDNDPGNPNPTPANPPTLSSAAVVTPTLTQRKDPSIHFANAWRVDQNGDPVPTEYRVRVAATDALGSQRVSDWIIITALPHTQPPPTGGNAYTAKRPLVVDETIHPASVNPQLTANAIFLGEFFDTAGMEGNGFPQAWGPRANAAVASHPSGVTFIIGGENLGPNGSFQGLVGRGDANYAYVPTQVESSDGSDQFGKYGTTPTGHVQSGGVIRLNDGGTLAPPFPNTTIPAQGPNGGSCWSPETQDTVARVDTFVPLWIDPQQPPALPPASPTSRSTIFTIVGSAAAVFVHEPPETNDDGLYPGPLTPIPQGSIDEIVLCPPGGHYPWPDCFATGWNIDNPQAGAGLGVPVVYVLGGRTSATNATNLVQKYYPYGFGTEDIVPASETFRFQTTNNQADIWSNYFLRPDRDAFPGSGINFEPQIEQRTPGSGDNPQLPDLPLGLYGHMAVRLQTGKDFPTPTFPQSGYSYIFVMGGLEGDNAIGSDGTGSGAVQNTMYYWDTTRGLEGGDDPGEEGLWSQLPPMPSPRAYGQAVVITDLPLRIAVFGGFDQNNAPLNTVDIYTFANNFNPVQGTWSSFTGSLEEAMRSTAVGWHNGVGSDDYVLSFGGFAETDFTDNLVSYRLGSGGTVVEALPVVPRGWHKAGQGGAAAVSTSITYNRYVLVGGATEQGTQNIVEVVSLP